MTGPAMTRATTGPAPAGLHHLLVVVPARDEEARLGACLHALTHAVRRLGDTRPDVTCSLTVVLDRCTDGSAAVAAAHAADVLVSRAGNVGAARAAGVAHALRGSTATPARTWLACTDADSRVPADWLLAHVRAADDGADLALGGVVPGDDGDLRAVTRSSWHARHDGAAAGVHVHGANLGVRLDAYLAAGGFAALAEHEDVTLVSALRRAGAREGALPPVDTSARRLGRTPGGFAGYLAALEDGRSA